MTRTWAVELGPVGIRVNTVAPVPTRTEVIMAAMGEEAIAADGGRTAV